MFYSSNLNHCKLLSTIIAPNRINSEIYNTDFNTLPSQSFFTLANHDVNKGQFFFLIRFQAAKPGSNMPLKAHHLRSCLSHLSLSGMDSHTFKVRQTSFLIQTGIF